MFIKSPSRTEKQTVHGRSIKQFGIYATKKGQSEKLRECEAMKLFSCSSQLSMKLQLLIKTNMLTFLAFKLSGVVFFHTNKC